MIKQKLPMLVIVVGPMAYASCEVYAVSPPKNIIVMISDGCGYNQMDATSIYQ